MVGEAKQRLGMAMQIDKEEEAEEEEKDMEGMEEGRRGGLRISGKKNSRRDERRERNERRKWEALLEWSEWDKRLIALAPVIVSSIQTTHQTLDEQHTALIMGEWALAAHRQAYRRREDVCGVPGGRAQGYCVEEGPLKRAMQEKAKRLLKKAEEYLSNTHTYFRRHIMLEQEVREALNAHDPAAELLLMGGRKREIVMPTSLTEPDDGGGQRLMHMATHSACVVGREGGWEAGMEGGREERLETLVQMALAGQEGRSQVISDVWARETIKGRSSVKGSEAVGAVASVLKGGVGEAAATAATAAAAAITTTATTAATTAAEATGTLRRRIAPAGKSKIE
eukprot:evm.model.NODE_53248_length_38388_cov_31.637205.3